MTSLSDLRAAFDAHGTEAGRTWLADSLAAVTTNPGSLGGLFPAASRRCGRAPLPDTPEWTVDQAARALLLGAAPAEAPAAYRYGDTAEKLAVLKALPLLPIGDAGVPLLRDALRTNDTRLVAAALGPYAVHLDDAAWRQAVLKCVFMGVPLAAVHGLDARADAELVAMLGAFAEERRAAGRPVPPDAVALLDRVKEA